MIRAAVVDDQEMVRDGFGLILASQPDIEVALQAADGQAFVDSVRNGVRLDVALVDIRMPVMDGIQATRLLATVADPPAVIVVTTFDDDAYVLDAIAAGARGFLLKRCSSRELIEAVRTVAHGESILSPQVTEAVLARVRKTTASRPSATVEGLDLTEREFDVLELIGAGLNNAEIAARLHLTVSTVKTHVGNLLAKSGSRDRVQVAILAIRAGLAR